MKQTNTMEGKINLEISKYFESHFVALTGEAEELTKIICEIVTPQSFQTDIVEELDEIQEDTTSMEEKLEAIEKLKEPECTLEPYCKCEDCQNYQGNLPIDRL